MEPYFMYVEEDNLSFLNKLDTLLDPDKRAKERFLREFTIGLINASYKKKPIEKKKIKLKIIDPVLRSIVHGKVYN